MLKQALAKTPLPKDMWSQIMFSFVLHKYGKDEKEKHHSSNRGMLTLEQGWGDILNACKKNLH